MKTILVVFVLFSSQIMISQISNPLLYDTEWHINYIVIDSQFYSLPEGFESEESFMFFSENTPHFVAAICSTITGDIEPVISENLFGFQNSIVVDQQPCDAPLNTDFDALHYNFFVDNANEVLSYDYFVIEPFFTPFVTITAPNGDIVEYFSDEPIMAVSEFERPKIYVYPNPFVDELQIDSPYQGNVSYEVFDLKGQIVKSGMMNTSETVALNRLKKGMYLMKFINEEGLIHAFKIVKN